MFEITLKATQTFELVGFEVGQNESFLTRPRTYIIFIVIKKYHAPAGVAEWTARSLVERASTTSLAQIILLPKLACTVACPPLLAWWMSRRWACCIHTYTVCTPISGKGRCSTRHDLRFSAHKQVSVQVREPPWLWNPWAGSHEVQNRGNQWPHKWTLVQQNIFKKKEYQTHNRI